MNLKDYPALKRNSGNWQGLDHERGALVKAASKKLNKFAKWFESSPWFGKMSPDMAATIWAIETGHNYSAERGSNRWAFQQVLGQLYEQHALGITNKFPPHINKDRLFFFLPTRTKRKTRAPTLALA